MILDNIYNHEAHEDNGFFVRVVSFVAMIRVAAESQMFHFCPSSS